MVSIVVAIFFMPWLWFDNAGTIFFNILGAIGGALGPVAGIMIADFYIVRRREYSISAFYTKTRDIYLQKNGWNPAALIALAIGLAASFIGLVVPALEVLYTYSWFF
ncbi:hypothetical protein GCM10020331_015430 [Ectobacillus funiculus]